MVDRLIMVNWNFLTKHARVLMCIAHDPGARLRDIAASPGITEGAAPQLTGDWASASIGRGVGSDGLTWSNSGPTSPGSGSP